VAVVQPGKSVHKAHRHAEEEYLALVEGSGTWSLDGKEFPAARGDVLYVEPWVYHGLTNTGDNPLIFLVVRYNGKGVPPPPQPDGRPNELTGPVDGGPIEAARGVKVAGVVTLDGRPLAGGAVTLIPEKKNGRPATGITDAEGRYVLKASAEDEALAPGQYKVTIVAKPNNADKATAVLPQRFGDPTTSSLRVDVVPGANEFHFDLTGR
jgi:hypothetical protein